MPAIFDNETAGLEALTLKDHICLEFRNYCTVELKRKRKKENAYPLRRPAFVSGVASDSYNDNVYFASI